MGFPNWIELPPEVLLLIFKEVEGDDICALACTCKTFYDLTRDQEVWFNACCKLFQFRAKTWINRPSAPIKPPFYYQSETRTCWGDRVTHHYLIRPAIPAPSCECRNNELYKKYSAEDLVMRTGDIKVEWQPNIPLARRYLRYTSYKRQFFELQHLRYKNCSCEVNADYKRRLNFTVQMYRSNQISEKGMREY